MYKILSFARILEVAFKSLSANSPDNVLKKKMQPRNGAASSVIMKYNLFLQTDYSERKVKRLKSVMVSSLSIDCR